MYVCMEAISEAKNQFEMFNKKDNKRMGFEYTKNWICNNDNIDNNCLS